MAQETDAVIDTVDLETETGTNGNDIREARRGSWSALAEAHAELFRLEAQSAVRGWRNALLRAVLLAFSGVAVLIFLTLAALYGLSRAGLSWGSVFLVTALFWGLVGGAVYAYGRRRRPGPVFAATQRQLQETARWLGRRFF